MVEIHHNGPWGEPIMIRPGLLRPMRNSSTGWWYRLTFLPWCWTCQGSGVNRAVQRLQESGLNLTRVVAESAPGWRADGSVAMVSMCIPPQALKLKRPDYHVWVGLGLGLGLGGCKVQWTAMGIAGGYDRPSSVGLLSSTHVLVAGLKSSRYIAG